MQKIDKLLVKNRFAGSLNFYSAHATVQQNMAGHLISSLLHHTGNQHIFETILEIGCGTGLLTREIARQLSCKQLLVNDLVPECKQYIESITPCKFIPGDIEHITIPSGLELIISNATLQWLNNPARTLAKLASSLKTNGIVAIASFGTDNLHEIAALTGNKLHYYSLTEWREMLNRDFNVVDSSEQFEKLVFLSPVAALQHLRNTGVTGLKQKTWTKTMLHNFSRDYISRYSVEGGIALTYHPIQLIAVKK